MTHFHNPPVSTGLHNMGGDPVTVIEDIRDLLDIGRDRKNPREDYLGEWLTWDPAPSLLRAWTLTLSSPSDVYVFGVGPLVDPVNINALASKKNNEQHVFKVKDMEDLENVFYKMIGRKAQAQGCGRGSCRLRSPTPLTL